MNVNDSNKNILGWLSLQFVHDKSWLERVAKRVTVQFSILFYFHQTYKLKITKIIKTTKYRIEEVQQTCAEDMCGILI